MSRRSTKKHDVSDLYAAVKHHHHHHSDHHANHHGDEGEHAGARLHVNVQHDCLRPRLRDYQKAAVLWMLTKEHYKSQSAVDQSHG